MKLLQDPRARWRRGLAAFVLVIMFVLVAACSALGLPVVKIDEAHYTPVKYDSSEVVSYKLQAGKGFILDGTGYTFVIPADADVPGPNMIQVVDEAGAVYTQAWDMQQTRYEVSASTLSPSDGGQAFPGLQAGKSYMVGVGNLEATGRFVVMWAAIVEVKPAKK